MKAALLKASWVIFGKLPTKEPKKKRSRKARQSRRTQRERERQDAVAAHLQEQLWQMEEYILHVRAALASMGYQQPPTEAQASGSLWCSLQQQEASWSGWPTETQGASHPGSSTDSMWPPDAHAAGWPGSSTDSWSGWPMQAEIAPSEVAEAAPEEQTETASISQEISFCFSFWYVYNL